MDGVQFAHRQEEVRDEAARKATTVGGSLRDVQDMLGHASLTTTQRYLEPSSEAKRKLVELI